MEIPLLTKGEAKVYEALVGTGESTVGVIVRNSGVSHSKVYDILKRLSHKGLVSTVNKQGRQHFAAADPGRLSELADEHRRTAELEAKRMEEVVMRLHAVSGTQPTKSLLHAYEGVQGIKTVLDAMLDDVRKGETMYVLGTPKRMGELLGGYLKDWQRRRIRKGCVCKVITSVDGPRWDDEWWEGSKRRKLTFSKHASFTVPAYIIISPRAVATVYVSESMLAYVVQHEEIAASYIQFFNDLWRR